MTMRARATLLTAITLLAWFVLAGCGSGPVCACSVPQPPEHLTEAVTSEEWAKARLAKLKGKHITTGILVSRSDSEGWEFNSRYNKNDDPMGLYQQGRKMFVERGLIRPEADGFAWHVEGKAAFLMNRYGVQYAVLVINKPEGPCTTVSDGGCLNLTAKAIPEGATLWIWWGDANASSPVLNKRPFRNPSDEDDSDSKKKRGKR